MKKSKIVMWIVSGMMAWGAITQGAEEDVIAQNIEQLRKQGIHVVDLSKVPVLRSRGPEMRAALEQILDEEYCGDSIMEGMTHAAALRGQVPVEGLGFVRLSDEDWPPVLLEMADEKFECLSREGELGSPTDCLRLCDMIGLLEASKGDHDETLIFLRKMSERLSPTWDTLLLLSICHAWVNLTIETEGVDRCLELGRLFETSFGIDSLELIYFIRQLAICDAFGRCPTDDDRAWLSCFLLDLAARCQKYGSAILIDRVAAGEEAFYSAENDPFAFGRPKVGISGWKGSLQRKRLAARFRDEPARGGVLSLDVETGEWVRSEPTQRDIDQMLWSRAAAELAADESELTDLREVYGDWTKE